MSGIEKIEGYLEQALIWVVCGFAMMLCIVLAPITLPLWLIKRLTKEESK